MFSIGDVVIYGATGVCKVTDIVTSNLTGVMREYYILRPVDTDKSIIYVPVDNDRLTSRMRVVPTSSQLREILSKVKGERLDWISDYQLRTQMFQQILSEGDIVEIIKLIRALHTYQLELSNRGKRLVKSDERIYKECAKLLCSEISLILKIEKSEILPLILDTTL